jgi:hypothetical protein
MIPGNRCLIELHYLPCIAWFAAVHRCEAIVIERHEHFVKQSYRNRCHILGANRVEKLIIPTTLKSNRTLITDVRIDYTQKWLNNHWRSIESAYRNAPFFEYFADDLHAILFGRHVFLYELNFRLLEVCLKLLRLEVSIKESVAYENVPATHTLDLRNQVSPKHSGFQQFIKPAAYTQVFGHVFVTNLSIIDLLFCTGPEAQSVIEASIASK